jgi:hypothetical protein
MQQRNSNLVEGCFLVFGEMIFPRARPSIPYKSADLIIVNSASLRSELRLIAPHCRELTHCGNSRAIFLGWTQVAESSDTV